jgi:hypothetical protein
MPATDRDEGHPELAAGDQEAIMIPHPSTFAASAEEARQELVALVARERLSATVSDQTPRAPVQLPWRGLLIRAVRMTDSGLGVRLRPRAWTHA